MKIKIVYLIVVIIVCGAWLEFNKSHIAYGDLYYDKAYACKSNECVTKKMTNLKKSIKHNPKRAESYLLLAEEYEKQNLYSKAIKNYQEVVSLDNRFSKAFFKVGEYHFLNRNFEEAFRYLNLAFTQNQNIDDYIAFYLAQIHEIRGQYELAENYYQIVLGVDSQSKYILYRIVICQFLHGNIDFARKYALANIGLDHKFNGFNTLRSILDEGADARLTLDMVKNTWEE